MISASHRFHGHASLNFVYRNGRVVRSGPVSLKYSSNPKRQTYRAAVVISRKINKSAVVRNRIRRRIYEVIRLLEPAIEQPFDMVFTVFSDQVETMEPQKLSELISSICKKANIIK